jgi:hypothetical protein
MPLAAARGQALQDDCRLAIEVDEDRLPLAAGHRGLVRSFLLFSHFCTPFETGVGKSGFSISKLNLSCTCRNVYDFHT